MRRGTERILIAERLLEQEHAREPMTKMEARRRIERKWQQGYSDVAAARYPDLAFATPRIAEAIGRIEAIGHPPGPVRRAR